MSGLPSVEQALAFEGSFFDACWAAADPSRPLIAASGPDSAPLSYGDAERFTAAAARLFAAWGLQRGDRVAVQIEKRPQLLLLYLACMRYGAVFVPVNPDFTATETAHLIEDSRPALVVCSAEKRARLQALAPAARVETMNPDGSGAFLDLPASGSPLPAPPRAGDPAVILYTSGTTGRPKGAIHTHRSILVNGVALANAWRFTREDVLLHCLPFFHSHGLFVSTSCSLVSGSSLLWHSRFDIDAVCADLPAATVFMGVPTMYHRLLKSGRLQALPLERLRLFACGSSALSAEDFAAFKDATGQRLLERYGMSEAGIIATNPYDGERKPKSVGRPLAPTALRVVDANEQAVAPGVAGGVQIKGPAVFQAYWEKPEKTAEEFSGDGWFRTGDVGYLDADGYLFLVARSKDVIISGGYNVYPAEVEDVLKQIRGVSDAAVFGLPHPEFGDGVTAVVCVDGEAGGTPSERQVISDARLQLVGYKVPKRVFFVEELPRNALGKVLKEDLKRAYARAYEKE